MVNILELDNYEIGIVYDKMLYLQGLNKFREIFKDFEEILKEKSLYENELIVQTDEEKWEYQSYRSIEGNETIYELMNILFDKFDEEEIIYGSYIDLIESMKSNDEKAKELYEILTKEFLFNGENIEELLTTEASYNIYYFYSETISEAIKKVINIDENKYKQILIYASKAFETDLCYEYEYDVTIIEKADEFYICIIMDVFNIVRLIKNLKEFYDLFKYCKDILEGRI